MRRRRRHLRQERRGGRGGPHHHLQLRAVSHGGPRLASRSNALRGCQRDRRGDGRRGTSRCEEHASPGGGLRHRPVSPDAGVPEAAEGDGLFGHPELPDGRAHRRQFQERPGSHRDGIRQRGRGGPRGTPDGYVHRTVCLRRTAGGNDGRGGRGHAGSPCWAYGVGHHRRDGCHDPRRGYRTRGGNRRGGP